MSDKARSFISQQRPAPLLRGRTLLAASTNAEGADKRFWAGLQALLKREPWAFGLISEGAVESDGANGSRRRVRAVVDDGAVILSVSSRSASVETEYRIEEEELILLIGKKVIALHEYKEKFLEAKTITLLQGCREFATEWGGQWWLSRSELSPAGFLITRWERISEPMYDYLIATDLGEVT